jgi:UDP-N-acetyl-D-glucosamine dehydrogenase
VTNPHGAQDDKHVAIVGQGYVGLPLAMAAASAGWTVVGIEKSESRVAQLNLGSSPVEDVSDLHLKTALANGKYVATSELSKIEKCQIVIVCVPTPLNGSREPDLSLVEAAIREITPYLSDETLIVSESTSYPGTIRNYIKPAIEKYSKAKLAHEYAISPERVDPGRVEWNQKNTPRLFAGLTPEATRRTREFYATFCDNLVEVSSPEVAEAAKLFENTFRQVNIALVNELAQISHALGIDVRETLDAANTKPYGFMKFTPSAGVGGHCIPVDPSYLAHLALENGVRATFIERANEVNLEMPTYIAKRVASDNGGSLKGKKVLVVGVAYKRNVADTRETPAEHLIEALNEMGAVVTWSDEVVGSWKGQSTSALSGADIAIVVTKHDVVSSEAILKAAPYVFDTTGVVKGAVQL